MGVHDLAWEEIAEYLEGVRRRRPALGEVVDLQGRILSVQHAAAQTPLAPLFEARTDRLAGRNSQGLPVVPRGEFPIDVPAAAALFRALLDALVESGAEAGERAVQIQGALATGALDAEALLRGAVRGEERDAIGGLDPNSLRFLTEASVRPCAEALARALGRWVEGDRWLRPTCPVCGSPPKIAELRGAELAASRYLHCGFCGWAWAYRRSACPFCGNLDHNGLGLLLIEDDPRVKIETCQKCRRYIKVVDNKEFFGLIPFLEDLTTPHLDLLALERGYR